MRASESSKQAISMAKKLGDSHPEILEEALECHADILEKSGDYIEANEVLLELKKLKDLQLRKEREIQRKQKESRQKTKELERKLTNYRQYLNSIQKKQLEADEAIRLNNFRKDSVLRQQQLESKKKELEFEASQTTALAEKKVLEENLRRKEAEKKIEDLKDEREKTTLKRQEDTNRLRIEKLNHEKRISVLKARAEKRERIKIEEEKLLFTILAMVLAAGVSFSIFFYLQSARKNRRLKESQLQIESANKALGSLNKELNTKNKSITDSIQYAKGIQNAILPSEVRWKEVFPDSFVFFKPKDIVSGDFYFLTTLEDKHIIAFADCTGHGVPGALMSIIGHNLLLSAIDLQGLSKPSEILLSMAKGLRHTLQKEGHDSSDGMEIGVCTFDPTNDLLQFSGSRRPLYGIQNGLFFEWKGDRNHLGSDRKSEVSFHEYSAKISEISELWLTSDGFADQFGGPDLKRFHSSNLKKILASLTDKPAPEQMEELKGIFNDWKGNTIQIDDVMVIGIRPQSFCI
jgi:serine phosphatase RsbU (regulator of sigma subunit)